MFIQLMVLICQKRYMDRVLITDKIIQRHETIKYMSLVAVFVVYTIYGMQEIDSTQETCIFIQRVKQQ